MIRHPRLFARKIGSLVGAMTVGIVAMLSIQACIELMQGRSTSALISAMVSGGDTSRNELIIMNAVRAGHESAALVDAGVAGIVSFLLGLMWLVSRRWPLFAIVPSLSVLAMCVVEVMSGSVLRAMSATVSGLFLPSYYNVARDIVLAGSEGVPFVEQVPINFMATTSSILVLLPVFTMVHLWRAYGATGKQAAA